MYIYRHIYRERYRYIYLDIYICVCTPQNYRLMTEDGNRTVLALEERLKPCCSF